MDCSNKDILFNIADWLFFETKLLLEIRGQTISYATFEKRQKVDRQVLLQSEIQDLESAEIIEQQELQDLRNDILNGKLIRSRAKWIQDSEKP